MSIGLDPNELDDLEMINTMKAKLVTMLLSLLEGEDDIEINNRMAHSLDFDAMKERLLKVYRTFVLKSLNLKTIDISRLELNRINNSLNKDSFKGNIIEAFEIFILLHTLADTNARARANLEKASFQH